MQNFPVSKFQFPMNFKFRINEFMNLKLAINWKLATGNWKL